MNTVEITVTLLIPVNPLDARTPREGRSFAEDILRSAKRKVVIHGVEIPFRFAKQDVEEPREKGRLLNDPKPNADDTPETDAVWSATAQIDGIESMRMMKMHAEEMERKRNKLAEKFTDVEAITEALEVSWYAMEKHAPAECEREINTSKKMLRKIGSLNAR